MINDFHVNVECVLPYVFDFKTLVGLTVCPCDSKNGAWPNLEEKSDFQGTLYRNGNIDFFLLIFAFSFISKYFIGN